MPYKLVMLGSSGAGKSALTLRLFQNSFVEEYEPTEPDIAGGLRGNLSRGKLSVDQRRRSLIVLDTSGSEVYRRLREDCLRWGHGFLLVYAPDCIRTFVDVSIFWDQLQRVRGTSGVPVVLVANKVDQPGRLVGSNPGEELARSFGVPYMETSAKTGQGVEQAFSELVQEIRKGQVSQERICGLGPCTIQ